MNQYIKLLAALLVLTTSALSTSQELHTFSNGEVADADKINENFNYVLDRASGGCSAKQEGSNVVITCPDGSQGVLASAGTVVRYPSVGAAGVSDPVTYNSGDIVVKDANDIVLGKVVGQINSDSEYHSYLIEFEINFYTLRPIIYGQSSTQSVRLIPEGGGTWTTVYWLTDDCSGPAWISPRSLETTNLFANLGDGTYYVPDEDSQQEQLLFKSGIVSEHMHYSSSIGWVAATECQAGEFVADAWRATTYTPAPEILNAAYPVRLEQLP